MKACLQIGLPNMKLITLAFAALLTVTSTQLAAQDFEKGLAAAQVGDFLTALQEWEPLAASGDPRAQFGRGFMYDNGQGLPQDDIQALKWYHLAAEQGHSDAQLNLGAMYRNGRGAPENFVLAAKWYRIAAKQGHSLAQDNLGTLYYFGHGVSQNNLTAHMWSNLAFIGGSIEAGPRRDFIAEEMTQDDLAIAQDMAKKCMDSQYQNCGD
jgi:TPR repeat protein